MEIEIKVSSFGESINEVTLSKWLKKDGDIVQQDEILCEIESEKATNELPAEKAGKLKIIAPEGSVLKIGDVICKIDTSVEVAEQSPTEKPEEKSGKPEEGSGSEGLRTPSEKPEVLKEEKKIE